MGKNEHRSRVKEKPIATTVLGENEIVLSEIQERSETKSSPGHEVKNREYN